MSLLYTDYQEAAEAAIIQFWRSRSEARQRHKLTGALDQGERSSVTSGKNMDGFVNLIRKIVIDNGLPTADIYENKAMLSLPGYFRATKLWDIIVTLEGQLVAVIELKSQVGPSFGNNFNNRAEETIGSAHDIWTAFREGAFGAHPPPFVGWVMMVEDAKASRSPVRTSSPHFDVFPEFAGASYLKRYDLLCQRLVKEQLYTSAALVTSEQQAVTTGEFGKISDMTSLKAFVATLAGHIAAVAARAGL